MRESRFVSVMAALVVAAAACAPAAPAPAAPTAVKAAPTTAPAKPAAAASPAATVAAKPSPAQAAAKPSPAAAAPASPVAKPSPATKPSPVAAPSPSVAAKPAGAAPAGPLTTVKVGYLNSASDAGILIGIEKGYFRAQGIELELQRFDSGATMTPALATGQIDVGAGSPSAGLYNAAARNIAIKIVADKGSDRPGFGYQGIALRKGLEGRVRDYADLKGLKIGMTGVGGTSPELVLAEALRKAGLTMKDVEIVQIGYPDLNTALNSGAIDAAVHFEPLFTLGVRQGFSVDWKRADEIYPNHQSAVIFYGVGFAEARQEIARRWMQAYVQGVRYYNDAFTKNQNKDEVIGILSRATGASAQVLAQAVPAGLNPDGYVNKEGLAADLRTLVELGYVTQAPDMNAVVDNQYADYAVQQLGRYQ